MPEIRRGSLPPKPQAPHHISSEPVLPTIPSQNGQNVPPKGDQLPHSQSENQVPITRMWSNTLLGRKTRPAEVRTQSNPETRQHVNINDKDHPGDHATDLRHHKSLDYGHRKSVAYAERPEADAYYDSRAGTHREWMRRGKTLQEYYDEKPELLPQLPFTWRHGKKRWRLFLFAFLVFVDASLIPIALYYGLYFGGGVEEFIIFAVVTTIWGGPTYLEFGIRTLRLIKKERFYRPLGTESRWCFDLLNWASTLTIFVVTVLFIVGSAPHDSWLRVLSMPAPAILWCLGGVLVVVDIYHYKGWPAPFRFSSTPKGGKVLPCAYYFVEDVAAVNAGAGRPFREALNARYKASPRFQQMLQKQSLFWGIPALILAVPMTVIAVIPPIPEAVSYGVCWAVPFIWAMGWGFISIRMIRRDLARERIEWQTASSTSEVDAAKAEIASPV